MKIALCEDEKRYIESITEVLSAYRAPDGEKIYWDVYENALDLIEAMKRVKYDALILDIILPGLSGINAARDIREKDMMIPIVFLTTSQEFAVESYRVHAFDYLMKPVNVEDLFHSLNDIYALKQTQKQDSLSITFAKGAYVIPFEQLVYLEISNRTLFFHLLDGTCKEVSGKISDYEGVLLSRKNYLKVHRSYIINMDHMKSYERKSFTAMTGESIPISRNIAKEVQSTYMDYLHAIVRGRL